MKDFIFYFIFGILLLFGVHKISEHEIIYNVKTQCENKQGFLIGNVQYLCLKVHKP